MIPLPYELLEKFWDLPAVGYRPSAEQRAFHEALLELSGTNESPQPTLVVVGGGIQGGKSFSVSQHILGRWLTDKIVWLVGRRYEDAEREYCYVRDEAVALGIALADKCSYAQNGPWEMEFVNGHRVVTLSSDDVTRLASVAPDGIVMCEPGRQTREAFETCWDRVLMKQGWLAVVGTFERAAGWYRALAKECEGENEWCGVFLKLPTYANREYCPQGIETPWFQVEMKKAKADPAAWDRFQERFLGIPRVPHDMVFYEFLRSRHVRQHEAEYDPAFPVYLSIDPGIQFANVVLFIQVVNGQVRVFDEIYVSQVLNRDIITMVEQHYAFRNVEKVVGDPRGATQRAMGQEAVIETWQTRLSPHGIPVVVPEPRPSLADRLTRVHDYLGMSPLLANQPGLIFHPRCKSTIGELEGWVDDDGNERGYRYQMTDSGQIVSETPIARDDHAASAIGYFLLQHMGRVDGGKRRRPQPVVNVPGYMTAYGRR